jgi:HTH-type transcriptional dual regulator CecR, C-terminal domain
VVLRALSVAGPAVLLRRARPLILSALGWPDFAGERLALIKRVFGQQIEATLA